MFGALKHGRFRSLASLILVVNVVGELQRKRTLAASRGFLAAARLSCLANGRYEILMGLPLTGPQALVYKYENLMSHLPYSTTVQSITWAALCSSH